MDFYYHSVKLDKAKCVGCTNCLKRCPTEAIRIREGRARIIEDRCIDCGECIRVCQHHAKVAVTNPLSVIQRYRYRIALPAPTLYGQFKNITSTLPVIKALKTLGFDEVREVARGADIISRAVAERLASPNCPHPLISSACPAVLRLIQIRFPELLPSVIPLKSPMELAAIEARRDFCAQHGADPEDVGCFFITPCPAKMTAIIKPLGHEVSAVNGAISIVELYGQLAGSMKGMTDSADGEDKLATASGVGWACSGGEVIAAGAEDALAVDGIDNVIRVLEAIEDGQLPELKYFEGLACTGGCIGGPLVFENAYIARNRIKKLVEGMAKLKPGARASADDVNALRAEMGFDTPLAPLKVMQLGDDVEQSLKKLDLIEETVKKLPGLDCGSCGSPTCRALAEDIVDGYAREMDCLFLLKERVRLMAQQMVDLSETTREK